MSPRAQPEPYLQRTSPEAAPKRISGRTSYLLVRLAFHPYPQVIQSLCNVKRFAPPRGLTLASRCPWVAHQVSGLRPATPNALFRLAFAPAPRLPSLNLATKRNSSAHSSIGTPSPGLSQAPTACRHTVSGTVSLPFRGAFHLSLTVLVHYRSPRVFSLGEWSPQLPTGFLVSRGTQDPGLGRMDFAYGALTPCGGPFQVLRLSMPCSVPPVLQPRPPWRTVWASPRSLAATRGIVSFPRGTEMFQFPRFPRSGLCVQPVVTRDEAGRVAPFGDLRLSLLDS